MACDNNLHRDRRRNGRNERDEEVVEEAWVLWVREKIVGPPRAPHRHRWEWEDHSRAREVRRPKPSASVVVGREAWKLNPTSHEGVDPRSPARSSETGDDEGIERVHRP